MNRDDYLTYIDHFNNKRYDSVVSYFAPDITVEYFTNFSNPQNPPKTLHGRQAFVDSYKNLHEHVREVLDLGDFIAEGDLIFAELYTEFHCFKDYPASSLNSLKKGDVSVMTNWVVYNMEGDTMKRIRIAHFRMHDPKTAKFGNY